MYAVYINTLDYRLNVQLESNIPFIDNLNVLLESIQ